MKRNFWIAGITLAICSLLCGCSIWNDGSYVSVSPHLEENYIPQSNAVEVSSYLEMYNALAEMVENGLSKGIISVTGMDDLQIEKDIKSAILNVSENHPIGAYALDTIVYEVGKNVGKPAIAVELSYTHTRSEILRIKQTPRMDDVITVIAEALDACEAGVVVQVDAYEDIDFTQLVQDYMDQYPQVCMEMPQVSVSMYPNWGKQRVIELNFTYQTSRETLRNMQDIVRPVFASARLYVSSDAEDWEKYSQLYSFLMERYNYTVQTSITPAYSLLRHGVGDSKAFATVYAAMCQQAGLDCSVISGTRSAEAWCWNVLKMDDTYFYVDLLACSASGGFAPKLAEEMVDYVWDYSAHGGEPQNGTTEETTEDKTEEITSEEIPETTGETIEDATEPVIVETTEEPVEQTTDGGTIP